MATVSRSSRLRDGPSAASVRRTSSSTALALTGSGWANRTRAERRLHPPSRSASAKSMRRWPSPDGDAEPCSSATSRPTANPSPWSSTGLMAASVDPEELRGDLGAPGHAVAHGVEIHFLAL